MENNNNKPDQNKNQNRRSIIICLVVALATFLIFSFMNKQVEKASNKEISYDEFIKSSCLLLVLIYDCESVEIFSKDERITRSLFDNARRKGFSETALITDENDGRTKMDIL